MNTTSNYSTKPIRAGLNYAENSRGLVRSITSVAKTLFESAEHASKIAVVALGITLAVISLTKVVDSGTTAAQYCDAISQMVVR